MAVDTVSGTADAALAGIEGTYTYSDAGELLDRPVAGDVQRLEWDAEHHLAGVDPTSETAADQTAVYDTAGARLLRRVSEPGAGTVTTVYLPGGVELVHDSAKDTGAGLQTGEVTPRRDYSFAGQIIATRTGVNPADVTTWSVDAHGTPEYALGNAESAAATAQDESLPQRRERPFGADRGTAPDRATFPGEKGFVGSTRDEGVDLLQVGARPYDAVLGLFMTTDPLVDPADPASLNAYSYANQNPITFSDPSGLAAACIREGTCGASSKGTPQANSDGTLNANPFDDGYVGTPAAEIAPVVNPPREVYEQAVAVSNGYGDGKRPDKLFPHQGHTLDADQVIAAYLGQRPELWSDDFETVLTVLVFDPSACNGESAAACTFEVVTVIGVTKPLKYVDDAFEIAGKAIKKRPSKTKDAASGVGKTCKFNSFSADTLVLMGDASKKKFKDLKVGDFVMAQNPITGVKGPRLITAVWMHKDSLYDLEVEGRTIVTTEDHPFWSVTDQAWEGAEDLAVGEVVLTADGDTGRVTEAVDFETRRVADAYNLTVDDLHTYFVGAESVLVHNDDYNQAMRDALAWLEERGFRAEQPTLGRFGDIKGKPIGRQTANGKIGFRVEFDERSGAHVNVWNGKEKGPHFTFDGSAKTVTKIQGQFGC
ncbi:polymorphic toxin-type HINT domain-containing protein [Nocardioides sp. NPDC101246]|uniref:polymorphic toxin-type HINT domain-containing protein n=1 Tax=Nocardioides sp. NPDC101246 TaxID=3364336 RepID=UPI0037F2D423